MTNSGDNIKAENANWQFSGDMVDNFEDHVSKSVPLYLEGHRNNEKLMLGEASINTGEGIIFNMTPSPGATSCLGNAVRDVKVISEYLGLNFDEKLFNDELVEEQDLQGENDE